MRQAYGFHPNVDVPFVLSRCLVATLERQPVVRLNTALHRPGEVFILNGQCGHSDGDTPGSRLSLRA